MTQEHFFPNLPTSPRLGNSNALKHGLYAVKNRPALSNQIHITLQSASSLDPSLIDGTIQITRQKLLDHLLTPPPRNDFRAVLSWQRPILKYLRLINKLRLASWRRHFAADHLRLAAEHPLELIRWGFHQEGITRDADSFRASSNQATLIHASSSNDRPSLLEYQHLPGLSAYESRISTSNVSTCQRVNVQTRHRAFTFLSDAQWSLIAPLLPQSSTKDLRSEIKRGHPEANPRLLLDLIFFKLAHHLSWPDLNIILNSPYPAGGVSPSPFSHLENGEAARRAGGVSLLTVRRYYRRLYLSGRHYTLLKALYRDFVARSGTSIPSLLQQGLFAYTGHEVLLIETAPRTWQTRTALLFLQQSWHLSSRLLLEIDRLHHSRSKSIHQPSLPLNDFPVIYPHSVQQQSSFEESSTCNQRSTILNPPSLSSFLQQNKLSDFYSAQPPLENFDTDHQPPGPSRIPSAFVCLHGPDVLVRVRFAEGGPLKDLRFSNTTN